MVCMAIVPSVPRQPAFVGKPCGLLRRLAVLNALMSPVTQAITPALGACMAATYSYFPVALTAFCYSIAGLAASQVADSVYVNGKIYTVSENTPWNVVAEMSPALP